MQRRVPGRRAGAATSTRSKAGSTGSRPGGTRSRRSSAPGRTSRASCSRGRTSSRERRVVTRASAARRGRLGDASVPQERRVAAALDAELQREMTARADRTLATRYERILEVLVEVERARFGAWYEMFPRSAGPDPARSATFDEATARLSYVAGMGFDVLYLPPIHPIGAQLPQGAEQHARRPGPTTSGSPWAIGARGRAATRRSSRSSARSTTSTGSSRRRGRTGSRSRSTSPSRRRPIIPTSRSIPSGSATGPTARSSTPRTRRRSTRTSTRSTSSREDWQALWRGTAERRSRSGSAHGVTIFRVDNPAHEAVPRSGSGRSPR